ncbi:hypothetical protein FO519_005726 [Halicephalobus sp. NKZ332]|nr:hypothetical protein FO519_005726 [Halicephalobus sp. NKZ332]
MYRLLPRLQLVSIRCLSSATPNAATSSAKKDALMKLRKKTGYSYVNVRKAVEQFGPERLDEAEKWLKELARKEGWAKAAKLGSRVTSQGLVGAQSSGNRAAVVELNCETDFVASCDTFKELLDEVTTAALEASKNLSAPSDKVLYSQNIDLESVQTSKNRPVKEAIAMTVGKLGENINIARAQVHVAPSKIPVFVQCHPKNGTSTTEMGRYASILGISRTQNATSFPTEKLAAQLCQHIIGMKPTTLGSPQVTKKEVGKAAAEEGKDELNEFYSGEVTQMDEDETQLLRQSFMLNPVQNVHEYLESHGAEIISFDRIELGVKDD